MPEGHLGVEKAAVAVKLRETVDVLIQLQWLDAAIVGNP